MVRRSLVLASAVLLGGVVACDANEPPQRSQAAQPTPAPPCTATGSVMRLPDLPEASGLAVSRVADGRFWSHNDSGAPVLYALDMGGKPAGRVAVSGAGLEDWEAMAAGPCPSGSCLYVADIGDNNARRSHITIYRLQEPARADGTAQVDGVFHATYPDGAHDAETLLVAPDGTLHIVTKGDTGPIALYRFPRDLTTGAPMRLERVGQPISEKPDERARVTDGAVSPDGQRVAIRTNTALAVYPAADFFRGEFGGGRMFDLTGIGEPQGEAVAFGSGSTLYVAGEGGGKSQPGTLAVLSCPN